jgi:hypothetical protein
MANCFFINVPIGIIIFIACYFVIPETKSDEIQQHMDMGGVVLPMLSLSFIMIPVSLGKHGPNYGGYY